jgi:FSR family fosmidomycin resistance protein-like MFS transporter
VDAACLAVLFSITNQQAFDIKIIVYLFIIYNLLAFGLQMVFGYISDRFQVPRLFALLGMILIGTLTVIYLWLPFAAVIFTGIGNALFYIGGGTISLSLIPRKATAPGIFVAPGALGVLVGTLLGKSGNF